MKKAVFMRFFLLVVYILVDKVGIGLAMSFVRKRLLWNTLALLVSLCCCIRIFNTYHDDEEDAAKGAKSIIQHDPG